MEDITAAGSCPRMAGAALGAWARETGFAGYHADVAYFLKERGVSFIGGDGPNEVSPTGRRRSPSL